MPFGRIIRGAGDTLRDYLLLELLEDANEIRRATGFFASSCFSVAPTKWRQFLNEGGILKVVCSPRLEIRDIEAIKEGLGNRPDWVRKPVPPANDSPASSRRMLSWAVANGGVYIRIATVRESDAGLYHEKFGVVERPDGRRRAFLGSVNETSAGYTDNFELAQVFDSAESREVVADYDRRFDSLWNNNTPGLEVRPIHRALAAGVLESVDDPEGEDDPDERLSDDETGRFAETLVSPPELELRTYQRKAVEAWFDQGGRGIYAMATGTGKTITSLATALRLYEKTGGPLVLIVVVPYLVLVDQWIETMRWFGLEPMRCAGSRSSWEQEAHSAVRLANRNRREIASFVVSNATFARSSFQGIVQKLDTRTLLIADEVHNFGAKNLRKSLPERIALRLGLSATPERHRDPEGTKAVFEYFGGQAIEFGMKDAMATSPPALVPYRYNPVPVELTPDEYDKYIEISGKVARVMGADQRVETLPEPAKRLLIRRARLVGAAENKLPALKEAIAPHRDSAHTLVYCGDGSVATGVSEKGETDEFQRQIDAVVELLGTELEMNVASYTAETSKERRAKLLDDFKEGRLQALVAIRCLDEGLDVPNVRRAFILASTTNPRQFIQRRGRVLRRAPGKRKAEIFDFFTVPPPEGYGRESSKAERNMVRREMRRAVEFMRLATNATEARHRLWDVLERLNLLETLVEDEDGG